MALKSQVQGNIQAILTICATCTYHKQTKFRNLNLRIYHDFGMNHTQYQLIFMQLIKQHYRTFKHHLPDSRVSDRPDAMQTILHGKMSEKRLGDSICSLLLVNC